MSLRVIVKITWPLAAGSTLADLGVLTKPDVPGFSSTWAWLCLFALALFSALVPYPQGLLLQFRSLGFSVMLLPGPPRTCRSALIAVPVAVTLLPGAGRPLWQYFLGSPLAAPSAGSVCVVPPSCFPSFTSFLALGSCLLHSQPSKHWLTPATCLQWPHSGGGGGGGGYKDKESMPVPSKNFQVCK